MNKARQTPPSPLDEASVIDMRRRPEWQARWRVLDDDTVDLTRPPKPPRVVKLAAEPQPVLVDLAKTAVIVVDMQNDFFRDDGWFGMMGVDLSPLFRPIAPINRLLPAMRAAGVPVVWVNWGVRADGFGLPANVLHEGYSKGRGLSMGDIHPTRGYNILARGTWGAAIIDELDVRAEDVRVDKVRLSGFYDTELDGVLRHMGITTLLFTGVNLDRCVMTTLESAAFLGYDCLVVEDCTSTVHPEYATTHCLTMIKQLLGFVTTSDELIAKLAAAEKVG